MAKTRKDSRGYALHTGETQRKDGRYVYEIELFCTNFNTARSRKILVIIYNPIKKNGLGV